MTYLQAILLATIQGLAEFLPISSSGHLVIFQKLLRIDTPQVLFDIMVHLGTLIAIIFYFKDQLIQLLERMIQKEKKSWHFFLMIILGTLPAVVAGFFLQRHINQIFSSLRLVGVSLLITAGLLFSTLFIKKTRPDFRYLKWQDALFIGAFQAIAILPGVSRAGSTIVAGLWRKLDKETVFQFSFLLAIPAIIGAFVLQIPDLTNHHFNYLNQSILGMVVAGIVGYFALRILESLLKSAKIFYFGFYCLLLGILALL